MMPRTSLFLTVVCVCPPSWEKPPLSSPVTVVLEDVSNSSWPMCRMPARTLADLGDFAPRELQLAQGRLEELEALCVVDADLELGRVTQVSPSLLRGAGRLIKAKMRLLGRRWCPQGGNMRHGSYALRWGRPVILLLSSRWSSSLPPMRSGLVLDGGVVLQLVEQTGLGGGWCRGRLGGRQGVEYISGQRGLVRERGRGLVENRGQRCERIRWSS